MANCTQHFDDPIADLFSTLPSNPPHLNPPPPPISAPQNVPPPQNALPAPLLSSASRILVAAFLRALLDRLAALSSQHGADDTLDTSIKVEKYGNGYEVTKARLLENAKLVLRPFTHGPKSSKFTIEVSWLQNVFQDALKEVEESGSFSCFSEEVSKDEAMEKRVPESIEHVKALNLEMHMLRQQIQAEAAAHKEAVGEWRKSLTQSKQGIKELKKQNKLTAKYRADIAIAAADCNRRVREERLKFLKEEVEHLTNQVETEKRVAGICIEFLKKQNLQLMEEAINLAAGHDNDTQYMDSMLNRIKDQKHEKELLLSELEPRYMKEMAEKEEAEANLEVLKHLEIDELGDLEMRTKAATKIQKVWRGHKVCLGHSQELKKILKKRKELNKKKKKKAGEKKAGEKKKKKKK